MSDPEVRPIKNVTLRLPVLSLTDAKRECIIAALQIHSGDATAAARQLGIGKSTIFRLIGDLRITREERFKV